MYKVDVSVDESAMKAVERRRAAEAERVTRVFNSRARVIGLDLPALQRQVEEKRELQEMEKQRDMAHDLLRLSIDEMAMQQQKQEDELRGRLARDLVKYRAIYQRAEDGRDADVNYDRQGEPHVNLSVTDSALGPASMQVFQGEDINENERKRAQMETNEKTLRAQKEEREKQERMRRNKELLTCRGLVENDLRGLQLDALEEECRRADRIALSRYNQCQAEERTERERQEKLRKERVELAEIQHMVTSNLLTEHPETSRVLTDRWKGMSPQQIGDIHKQREEQRIEKERQREMQKQRELAWDYQMMERARQQEMEVKRERELERERRVKLDKYNQQLAREQAAHQLYLDKQLYTNRPTVQYFTQFNRSSR